MLEGSVFIIREEVSINAIKLYLTNNDGYDDDSESRRQKHSDVSVSFFLRRIL